jgi:hypothetical protein
MAVQRFSLLGSDKKWMAQILCPQFRLTCLPSASKCTPISKIRCREWYQKLAVSLGMLFFVHFAHRTP